MECKITSTKSGFTLLEVVIASALGLIGLLMVMLLTIFSGRSFAAITNYVALDQQSQMALDRMSREIRQAHRVTGYSPASITFLDRDKNSVQYTFDAQARTLVRASGAVTNQYLTQCDSLGFTNYQGTVISNSFDAYLPQILGDTRVIQVTWTCSGKILGTRMNTESVQSAKIVIRNRD